MFHYVTNLQDVPAAHLLLLLDYMYTGATQVAGDELSDVLTTATSLKIRGFGVRESVKGNDDGHGNTLNEHDYQEKFQKLAEKSPSPQKETLSKQGRRPYGRKSSVPKKLKLTETETDIYESPISSIDRLKFPILGSYLNSFKQGKYLMLGSGKVPKKLTFIVLETLGSGTVKEIGGVIKSELQDEKIVSIGKKSIIVLCPMSQIQSPKSKGKGERELN